MPNRNYIKGKNFEQKVVREAKADGKIAFRSAGSHSPFDVCIIDLDNRIIELSQLKAGTSRLTKKEKDAFKEFIDGRFNVVFTLRTQY